MMVYYLMVSNISMASVFIITLSISGVYNRVFNTYLNRGLLQNFLKFLPITRELFRIIGSGAIVIFIFFSLFYG